MAAGGTGAAASEPRVLESDEDWAGFLRSLSGKKLLHVKGFGSGFKDPTAEQKKIESRQNAEAQRALSCFRPDYVVVDGDPWGGGFQRYIKEFAGSHWEHGKTNLIWVKNAKLDSDRKPTPDERNRRMRQAREWAAQDLEVTVGWLDEAEIGNGVDELFGPGSWSKLQPVGFSDRGALLLLSPKEPSAPGSSLSPESWLSRLVESVEGPALLEAIKAIETRGEQAHFEKCSFENAAKGNAIFRLLRRAENLQAHGVISFGGGESVLLEFGSLYLNPGSASLVRRENVALLRFTRGRGGQDPTLPEHLGESFREPQLPVGTTVAQADAERAPLRGGAVSTADGALGAGGHTDAAAGLGAAEGRDTAAGQAAGPAPASAATGCTDAGARPGAGAGASGAPEEARLQASSEAERRQSPESQPLKDEINKHCSSLDAMANIKDGILTAFRARCPESSGKLPRHIFHDVLQRVIQTSVACDGEGRCDLGALQREVDELEDEGGCVDCGRFVEWLYAEQQTSDTRSIESLHFPHSSQSDF